jgi:hypothetical protein
MSEKEGVKAKYEVNIEGKIYEWAKPSITVPEIRSLGGLPTDKPIIEVELQTNNEVTLPEDGVIDLKPGHGFSRKVEFKRGRQ